VTRQAAADGTFGSSARPPDRLAFPYERAICGGVDTGGDVHHGDGVHSAFYTRRAARPEAGHGVDDPGC
jgi:hypothetical protein